MAQYIALSGKNGCGKYAIVDDEDYNELSKYRWNVNKKGYAYRFSKGKTYLMHRIIMGLDFGDVREIDHINHVPLDNQKLNLRICSILENSRNKRPIGGSSQYKGVYKHGKNWLAKINNKCLGTYILEKDAALAYDRAARECHGAFAYLNFPEITDYTYLKRTSDNYTSQKKGIYFQKNNKTKPWVASCNIQGKNKTIGHFLTEEAAYIARQKFLESLEMIGV